MREEILDVARGWIGTPYRHQCSVKGHGADCLGLLRGVWREVFGAEPEAVPTYTPDWSEASGEERLWRAARRYLVAVPVCLPCFGDVVLFRMRRQAVAKHVGILSRSSGGLSTLVHAYSGKGVVETPLTEAWIRRIVAQFEFPERRA
ncbi:peptidase [Amylibacter cionae]|nr:peptidase [Amylibacter cionae]